MLQGAWSHTDHAVSAGSAGRARTRMELQSAALATGSGLAWSPDWKWKLLIRRGLLTARYALSPTTSRVRPCTIARGYMSARSCD